jgi:cholesterol transport system auxiliary component
LPSCSILPAPETLAIYQLPPTSITRADSTGKLPWTLHVSTPHSSQVLDSQRVLALREDNRISAYKGVRWSEAAPILLRSRLAGAFRADGRLSPLSGHHVNLVTDFELNGDLNAFQVEHADGVPMVVIRFYAVLTQPGRSRIVAVHGFEARQPVEGKGMTEVIAAFGKATDKLAREMIDWTIQHGNSIQATQDDTTASAGERMNPSAEMP